MKKVMSSLDFLTKRNDSMPKLEAMMQQVHQPSHVQQQSYAVHNSWLMQQQPCTVHRLSQSRAAAVVLVDAAAAMYCTQTQSVTCSSSRVG